MVPGGPSVNFDGSRKREALATAAFDHWNLVLNPAGLDGGMLRQRRWRYYCSKVQFWISEGSFPRRARPRGSRDSALGTGSVRRLRGEADPAGGVGLPDILITSTVHVRLA